MKFEFDTAKNESNIAKHGVSLAASENFEWDDAIIIPDERKNYGETRYIAYGLIENRLHAMVFTKRSGAIRVISLRKANARERKKYG